MDLDALFNAPFVPPKAIEPIAPPSRSTAVSAFVPNPYPPKTEECRIEELHIAEREYQQLQKVESKKELAYNKVQEMLVDASEPATAKMVDLMEATRTIQTKDGDIITVPDPKTQLLAAKDILDRAGHKPIERSINLNDTAINIKLDW